jgi:hypothetical protein
MSTESVQCGHGQLDTCQNKLGAKVRPMNSSHMSVNNDTWQKKIGPTLKVRLIDRARVLSRSRKEVYSIHRLFFIKKKKIRVNSVDPKSRC